jgi:hypothetical protein
MKFLLLTLFVSLIMNQLIAQKLSDLQNASVKLNSNYKIDGEASEWNKTFSAKNKTTGIQYTIANNKEKLYLIIRAEEIQIIKKIINQGILFNIDNGTSKLCVAYPVYEKEKRPLFLPIADRKDGKTKEGKIFNDSLKTNLNQKMSENLLKIGVEGIPSVKDSLISIYNTQGIRVAGKFDENIFYTLEMAIPIEFLSNKNQINYTIQLNGVPGKVKIIESTIGNRITYVRHGENWMLGSATPENYAMAYPSSFSGKYILHK